MKPFSLSTAIGLCALCAISSAAAPFEGDLVAIKAGRIHTMDQAGVVHDGVMLIRDGRIVAIGKDLVIPPGTQVVDYGPDADLIPGLVAAASGLANGRPGPRSADASIFAVDSFDTFENRAAILASGVTSAYVDPAVGRFLGGVGGVVKLGGAAERRVINAWTSLDGSIAADAYNTQGFWEPPVPATADVGMGVEESQLPHSLQGAILALGQLADMAGGVAVPGFDPHLARDLGNALANGAGWRFKANTAQELRAIASFVKERHLPFVVDGAWEGADAAEELAAAGVGVVFEPRQRFGIATNWGKGEDAEWPTMNVPAALVAAGVPVAVAPGNGASLDSLYQIAMLASGGLTREQALATVTSQAAALIGASDRVGSLAVGKDADFVVLSGTPMTAGSAVRATWVDGKLGYMSSASSSVVLEVDELFVGDGTVLRPGQLLMSDGRIQEVGERVAHPRGAVVVRGSSAMPGMIDAFGHLGLEGSRKSPPTGFSLVRLLTPGDATGKHVAEAGVTTVMLAPYSISGSGTGLLAYKPAAGDLASLLVEDDAAVRIDWVSNNRYSIGSNVRATLERATSYRQSWLDYAKELAAWTPPVEVAEEPEVEEATKEAATEETPVEEPEKETKKKKKDKEKDPDALTGVWTATSDWGSARLQFQDGPSEGTTDVRGSLRSDALSANLLRFEGTFDHVHGVLAVHNTEGLLVEAKIDDEALVGTLTWAGTEYEFSAARQSREYVVVRRPEVRKAEGDAKPPKGMPKEPRLDPNLEPWRRALEGQVAVIVGVSREDEILDVVNAFAAVGIKPVLFGAEEAWRVKDQLTGRVAGVLPERWPLRTTEGIETVNRFAELQQAGIPVAFYSDAEEGAGDLFLMAGYAVAEGMSPSGALRALTADAAQMMNIGDRVGRLAVGLDADVLLLDASPLELGAEIQRTWVAGQEVVR